MNFDPNNLFHEIVDIYDQNRHNGKVVICNEGGSRCFDGNQLVVTSKGNKTISDIKQGDHVKSLNESTGLIEWSIVKDTFKFKNTKKSIEVKLKNGDVIRCTEDHQFYFEGGWYSLKHLLSLKDGRIRDLASNSELLKVRGE